jgi:hypothetical protein
MKYKIITIILIVFISGCTLTEKNTDLKNRINILIDEKNYCTENSDCTYLSDFIILGCPFDCYNFVNKNEDFSEIKDLSEQYFTDYNQHCVYGCPVQPKQNEITCKNNKCVEESNNLNSIECNSDEDCTSTLFIAQACCDGPIYEPISKQNKKLQDEWRGQNCNYDAPNNQPCPIIKYKKQNVTPFCNQGICDIK